MEVFIVVCLIWDSGGGFRRAFVAMWKGLFVEGMHAAAELAEIVKNSFNSPSGSVNASGTE